MDGGTWAGFLGTAILLTLMPGPDILFVAAQSASVGRKAGSAVALGLCTGLFVHIAAASLGVSAAVYRSHAAFLTVKWLGAVYLFYLAWQAWQSSRKPKDAAGEQSEDRAGNETEAGRMLRFGQLYRRGIWMNVLNPKVSLFFVALLPQFVTAEGGAVPLQMAMLGATFLVQALIIFHAVAFAAGSMGRKWIRGVAAHRRTAQVQAIIYALIGARLLVPHLP
ncbi:LysE family translocator [Cohnella caldifontis]|uniref:LysE family translocator n=1 Tax=Cohnella caldifontis TaxID=3027471 RepID=UPI0023EBA8D1|nr:LysE family translocator [Cohnella sp. YIM B05605]